MKRTAQLVVLVSLALILLRALGSGGNALAATPVQNLSNGSGNAESDIQTMQISGLLSRYRDPQIGPGTREALAIMVGICDGGVLGNTSATLLAPVAGAAPTIAGGSAAIPCIPSPPGTLGGPDGLATGINSAIIVFSGPGARFIRTVRMYADTDRVLFDPGDLLQQVTAQYNAGTGEAIAQFGRTQDQIFSAHDFGGGPVAAPGLWRTAISQTISLLLYFTADIGDDATGSHVDVALGVGTGDDTAQGPGGICFTHYHIHCGSNFMKSGPETSGFDIVGGAAPPGGGGGPQPPPPPGGGGLALDLHAGWNMISSPVGSVPLSALQGNCSIIGGPWWWDGTQYQQLATIDPGKGYWVKVGSPCTMQASGSSTPVGLILFAGWNMISSSGSWNLMNTGGCSLLGGPYWYDGTQYQSVDPNTPLNGFQGYWVKIGGSCSVNSQGLRLHSSWDESPLPPGEAQEFLANFLRLLGVPQIAMAIKSPPSLSLTQIRLTAINAGRIELQIQGTGIVSSAVRLYCLSGQLVAEAQGGGSKLSFAPLRYDGRPLANGVYLYIVAVRGAGGQITQSAVQKLVVMR
jgi:hypothetical protein